MSIANNEDWIIFTHAVLLLSSSCKVITNELEYLLNEETYDWHTLRRLTTARDICRKYARIEDCFRENGGILPPARRVRS